MHSSEAVQSVLKDLIGWAKEKMIAGEGDDEVAPREMESEVEEHAEASEQEEPEDDFESYKKQEIAKIRHVPERPDGVVSMGGMQKKEAGPSAPAQKKMPKKPFPKGLKRG